MYRIILVADSHGRFSNLCDVVERHINDMDMLIHLGDGEDDIENIKKLYPFLKIENVCGNCDFMSKAENTKILEIADMKILITHGHKQLVKSGYDHIKAEAKKAGANMAFFGHSHTPLYEFKKNMYLVNPGSIGRGHKKTYAIVDIDKKVAVVNINKI